MLNRIYIVVGMLAIVVLAAAFIVPRFIQWGDYRDRMEALASTVLGAEVSIGGDIEFSLLPQPRLHFSDVVVGAPDAPAASVAGVEAEFALMDFLRDNYTITALVLHDPVIDLAIDENGLFGSQVAIAPATNGVALGQARVENGTLRLTDRRSGERFIATDIDGDLRLSSFVGPFQFQGHASTADARYEVRFNSGPLDGNGQVRISSYLRQADDAFSLTAEGLLSAGVAPKFNGRIVYRQSPPAADAADDIRGDLVFESTLEASTDLAVLSGYTLQPDENRAGLRLTGSANIRLGAHRSFDAVISGGVFSLPPRDATEIPAELPYEAVRLLADLPAPPLPPMPGRLGIDLAEISLRGFALRNVRVEAASDGMAWSIEKAVATLPGETELQLSGQLSADGDVPGFQGQARVTSYRLDALAQLWRRPQDDNPLFNMPASLTGRVMLAGEAFGFNDGTFTLDGIAHRIDVRLGFGAEPRLDIVGHFGALDALHTAALVALLPEATNDPSFGISFPDGSFSVSATALDVLGLNAADFVAEGQWSPDALRFSRLAASDWGGLTLDSTLEASGSLAQPHLTGSGKIGVDGADVPGLEAFYELAGMPYVWQQALRQSWPADLQFILSDAAPGPGQVLTLGGTLGASAFDFRAEMAAGLDALATGDLRLVASLEADDGPRLVQQLGLGDAPLFAGAHPMLASLFLEGSAGDGLDGRVNVSSGDERIGFVGTLALAENGAVRGQGKLDAQLRAGDGLAALAGLKGAGLGGFTLDADVDFDGKGHVGLASLAGASGADAFSGALNLDRAGEAANVTGTLQFDSLDLSGLARVFLGPAALLGLEPGQWPEGPLAMNEAARPSRGDIAVSAGSLHLGAAELGGETRFDLVWEPRSVGLSRFRAAMGGGTLTLDLEQCCAGALEQRTLSGRVTLAGVDLDAMLPPAARAGLDGRLDGGMQFEGAGESLAEVVRRLSGEGNFTLADFRVRGLDTGVYPALAGLDDVLDTDAAALQTYIGVALGQGDFTASAARGAFTIAAGTARLGNFIVEGAGGRLSGSLDLALETLGLDGGFVLTPRDFVDATGLVQPDSARIVNRIGGTLLAPEITLDLDEIVAAIQVRANEIEVDRLEQLRLADEARQREAAEARNRLIEEQKRQAAEAEARRAAEAEAQRQAQEEAQAQQREEAEPVPPPPDPQVPPPQTPPLDLGFQGLGLPANEPLDLFPD